MKIKLPNSVSSPQDLQALAGEIKEYSRWYSHNAIKKQIGGKASSEQPALSPSAVELLNGWSTKKPLSQESISELIVNLESFSDSAPSLAITLAAPPTNSLKITLVAWCRENIAPDALVTFRFNATILGGMVVRSGSHIYDWSFRRQILEARGRFPEVLRRV